MIDCIIIRKSDNAVLYDTMPFSSLPRIGDVILIDDWKGDNDDVSLSVLGVVHRITDYHDSFCSNPTILYVVKL